MKNSSLFDKSNLNSQSRSLLGILLLAVFLFSFTTVSAAYGPEKPEKTISNQLLDLVEYPNSILSTNRNVDDEVMLFFEIEKGGLVDVHKVEGNNPELNNYVTQTLQGKHINHLPDSLYKQYKIVIRFKTI